MICSFNIETKESEVSKMSNTTNKESALVVAPTMINSLQCKELAKETKKIILIAGRQEKDKWLKAKSLYTIFDNEWYKDDYKSFTKYVEAIKDLGNESKSTYSKMVNAYKFIVSEKAQKYGFTTENMIYASAYLLSTVEDLDGFMDYVGNMDVTKVSYSTLEKLLKTFKEADIIDVEAKSTEADENETQEEVVKDDVVVEPLNENEITATIEKGLLMFTYKNKSYIVPMKELKQYQVKKETKEA